MTVSRLFEDSKLTQYICICTSATSAGLIYHVCFRAEDQPQNVMIAQIAKAMFPELLERRLRETEAEKAKFELCLPAFFYNVPVFPGQSLCLHFFEPRYKLMMRRIIDTSRR